MNNIISEYQKWKQQGQDLRVQAKQAMEARFRELLQQAIQLAEEYRADFGGQLKPPPGVTSFRYKASAKAKGSKAKNAGGAAKSAAPVKSAGLPGKSASPAAKAGSAPEPSAKTAGLQKKLAAAQQKLEQAKANGAATKNWEDKIYEIEDAIRLSSHAD